MLRHCCILMILTLCLSLSARAGSIKGRVTDEKTRETIIGATVRVQGGAYGALTDMDGIFTINLPDGTYDIEVSYVGYLPKQLNGIRSSAPAPLDIVLSPDEKTQLQEVVVRGSLKKENISAMIVYQKNANTVASVVSAESIRKSPDRNTGDVLKRVSAASIQDGKYLVVRGLADRYNQAMLNGALLSSTEPDRKTFSFDLFPASMIDNIVINKAATPDLPAEFAGGLIQVNTREIPSEPFMSIQLGTGFNSQTLGRDFYSYQGGKTDFLGLDDGSRALPAGFPDRAGLAAMSTEQRSALTASLPNDWAYKAGPAPLNKSFQLSAGMPGRFLGRKTGAMLALSYNNTNRRTELQRAFFNQSGALQKTLDFRDQSYNQEVLWGALANFSMELNPRNIISFKNLFNVNATDNTLLREGRNNDFGGDVRAYQLGFKSTQYLSSQLQGSHELEQARMNISWNAGLVRLQQDQPNLRRMEYRRADGDSIYRANVQSFLPSLSSASRFYASLTDNIVQGGLNVSHSFTLMGQPHTIKAGAMAQQKERSFSSRPLGLVGSNQQLATLPNDQIFASQNLGGGGFLISELGLKDYDYAAQSSLGAAYLMLDNKLAEKWTLVWGLRAETFNQQLQGFQNNKPVGVNTTVTDLLPSVNLTWRQSERVNWRMSASQTVVRPEFRELSPFAFFDFELLAGIQGNPELQRTRITNLDLRYELYPKAGEMITAGLFYKRFENSIEQFFNESGVNTFTYTFGNAPEAFSYGAEVDFRKKLDGPAFLPYLTAFANASYIFNQVRFDITGPGGEAVTQTRPMQGQSPYVINGGLQFDYEPAGTNATALFNMVGRRIFLVGNEQNPHIWEAPRPVLDLQLSQKILKRRAELKLTVSDVLNRPARFYQDKNEDGRFNLSSDFLRINRLSGTNASLSFSYNLR